MGTDSLLTDRVTIVITCYNQARFLTDAIDSALAQTYPRLEILVIDDGSTDDTSDVAARYPGIRYIRCRHAGLAAARNVGIRESAGTYLVFLDADDRLLPPAVDAGITFFRAHPDCAFVFGHHRLVAIDGSRLAEWRQPDVGGDHYLALLRRNHIAMHATVMYRRTTFERIGGFDPSFRACEDYELYLRIARTLPVGCYETIIAEYRQHNTNMSRDYGLMLRSALAAHRTQWKYARGRTPYDEAYQEGRQFWQTFYGKPLVEQVQTQLHTPGQRRNALKGLFVLLLHYPSGLSAARHLPLEVRAPSQLPKRAKTLARRIGRRLVPGRARRLWRAWRTSSPRPLRRRVRFGSLRRLSPISRSFGFDRGQPIDRFYIEHFLSKHAADVRGQVLEIGDNAYTLRFGEGRVSRSDVLHVVAGNTGATIVADLTRAAHIPAATFDCIIFTQTLHLIYDVRAAIETLHRILKPGGVVLATFPGTSQVSQDEWREYWCWSFTVLSARRLFEEYFSAADLHVEAYGNVLTAVAFLHGLAAEELRQNELQHHDPQYQLLIAVRAQKRAPSA
jgi:glycosyltransferase involved in cell wall biosynthesis